MNPVGGALRVKLGSQNIGIGIAIAIVIAIVIRIDLSFTAGSYGVGKKHAAERRLEGSPGQGTAQR